MKLFCIFSSLAPGTWIRLSLVFTKSLHRLAGQYCDQEIDEFSYSAVISRPRFTESFDRLGRRLVLLQRCRSGNQTRVRQLELTLFRVSYPLDQRSFPFLERITPICTYKHHHCYPKSPSESHSIPQAARDPKRHPILPPQSCFRCCPS